MFDSSKGHTYKDCVFRLGLATPYQQSPYQRRPQPNNGMKILMVQDPSYQDQQPQVPPSYQHLPLQECAPSDQSYYSQPQYPYLDSQAAGSDQYYDSYAAAGYEEGYGYYDHAYPPQNSQL